ncbi:MAG: hypothetical protein R3B89_05090 [Polyangiaceae bacterium]
MGLRTWKSIDDRGRDRSEAGARGGSTAGSLAYFEERTDEAARRSKKIGRESD